MMRDLWMEAGAVFIGITLASAVGLFMVLSHTSSCARGVRTTVRDIRSPALVLQNGVWITQRRIAETTR